MKSPDQKPAYRGADDSVPVAAYVIVAVLALGLLAAVFFQEGRDKNKAHGNYSTPSTQRADRPGSSTGSTGSTASTASHSAAAADAPPPLILPAELIAKERMQALENTTPSLEPPKQCYWLDKKSIPPRWLAVKAVYGTDLGKQSCFELDSCDGGQAKSRGDCYKWAASPTTERDPW